MDPWIIFVICFVLFDLLLVAIVVWKRNQMRTFSSQELTYIRSHWIRIIDSFNGNVVGAIIDADKVLDYALARKGFQGSVGEKLKKAGPRFSDVNGVWRAHKYRNKLAHELGGVKFDEARDALSQFKRALNDLGAGL